MTEEDVKKCIRANIYALMDADAPTVSQVEKRLGVSHGSAQRIVDGSFPYKAADLVRIADALGCEAWDLLRPPGELQSKIEWPFRLVPQDDYEALHPEEKGAAQIAMRDEVARLTEVRRKQARA